MIQTDVQKIPIRLYQTDEHVILAAPMPGLEPSDISVTIAGDHIRLRGDKRGPDEEWRDLLMAEWRVGPYDREITLPTSVDGALSNATFGNGVLVLSMPKAKPGQNDEAVDIALEVIEAPRGERVGHTGHDMRKTTTQEHRRLRERTQRGSRSKRKLIH